MIKKWAQVGFNFSDQGQHQTGQNGYPRKCDFEVDFGAHPEEQPVLLNYGIPHVTRIHPKPPENFETADVRRRK